MRLLSALALVCSLVAATPSPRSLWAQDLSPRAYVITPLHSNAIIMSYSFYHGSVLFDGAAPITGATGTYSVPVLSYYHSFSFLGRSANVNVSSLCGRDLPGHRRRPSDNRFTALVFWIYLSSIGEP